MNSSEVNMMELSLKSNFLIGSIIFIFVLLLVGVQVLSLIIYKTLENISSWIWKSVMSRENAAIETVNIANTQIECENMKKLYCCNLNCFVRSDDELDGIACHKCESFGYCICLCKSYNSEKIS